MRLRLAFSCLLAGATACTPLDQVGRLPDLSRSDQGAEYSAMLMPGLPPQVHRPSPAAPASLWRAGERSLLGDRRAEKKGDILTIVIDINDSAAMVNSSQRSRTGKQDMRVGALFGLEEGLPLAPGVETSSSSQSQGSGTIRRTEKLTLRVAATVVETLPNGVLAIAGSQEVRVNFELRELLVTGYVRSNDISRQNEITYDKIASARISYGGRGRSTEVQQPKYGQQLADIILPF